MSDKEDSLSVSDKSEPGLIGRSRSPSENGSQKSYNGSMNSHSASRSPVVYKRSRSRSGSRSHFRVYKRKRSYSRSRSRSHPQYSRSRSRSPHHHKRRSHHHRSRSHSRSNSHGRSPTHHRDGYSDRRRGFQRSHSRSPMSQRRRHQGNRDNPVTSRCLGVFGLSMYTTERELRDVFIRYGNLEDVNVVYDRQSGRSRGFAFVYFASHEDAFDAKERCNGTEVDGRRIRVDFSITKRAHTPTPGIYLGKPTGNSGYGRGERGERGDQGGRRRSPSPPQYRHNNRRYNSRSRSRSRSYSPRDEERKLKLLKNEN